MFQQMGAGEILANVYLRRGVNRIVACNVHTSRELMISDRLSLRRAVCTSHGAWTDVLLHVLTELDV